MALARILGLALVLLVPSVVLGDALFDESDLACVRNLLPSVSSALPSGCNREDYKLVPVDLNLDKTPAYLVADAPLVCGSAGCRVTLLTMEKGIWLKLAEVMGAIRIEKCGTSKRRDITLTYREYLPAGGSKRIESRLTWNGASYGPLVCASVAQWTVPKPSSEVGSESVKIVRLPNYAPLCQRDLANYSNPDAATECDFLYPSGPLVTVMNQSCLSTVYAMLERGRGNAHAMIDHFYVKGDGPVRPSYVGEDTGIDFKSVHISIQLGQPVVLHGYGGPLREHYALATGTVTSGKETIHILALDPWTGAEILVDPKTKKTDALHEVEFRKMRTSVAK
jgi:hypothetical protein